MNAYLFPTELIQADYFKSRLLWATLVTVHIGLGDKMTTIVIAI